jgi:hypothetical protein
MGPITAPVSLEDPLRCGKPGFSGARGLVALSKPLSRSSKKAMVSMRLIFPFAQARERFLILPRSGAGRGTRP